MKQFLFTVLVTLGIALPAEAAPKYNVLFIISDDLTSTALSCYGNTVCKTPNIDAIAARGTRFTRAYCQGTYCGPSRASFLTGYYPHAIGVLGYKSPRPAIGDRVTWPQHFKNHGYYSAPSRASFMSGYYPHATGVLGYKSPRPAIGSRVTWSQHFKNNGYYAARVSKIYHMGVPIGIEQGSHGAGRRGFLDGAVQQQGPRMESPG